MPKAFIDRDGLHFNDDGIERKVNYLTISATLIEGMLECPAKFVFSRYLQDEVIPPQPDSPLTRGSAFHRTLELYYGLDESKRPASGIDMHILSAAMRKAITEAPVEVRNDDVFIGWLKNALKRYTRMNESAVNVRIANYTNKDGLTKPGLEMPVSGIIGNATRRSFGMIDRLIQVNNDDPRSVIIDDYKTGKSAKAYDPHDRYADFGYIRQQTMYAMLLEKDTNTYHNGFDVCGGRLIYPVADNNKDTAEPGVILPVDVKNQKYRDKTIKDVELTSRMLDDAINTNTYSCNPSKLCSWCPLANICPRADKDDRDKFVNARASQPDESTLAPVIEK